MKEEDRLKQRLIGAVVLVALGVIFIPMILSGGRDTDIPQFGSNVPPIPDKIAKIKTFEPEVKTDSKVEIPQVVPIEHAEHEPAIPKNSVIAKNSRPAETKLKKPGSDSVPREMTEPHGWVVQVGSFSNKKNALALRDKLRKNHFTAFVERVMNNNKPLYRVRVGPETRQQDAKQLEQNLLKKMKLKGLVVKHP